MTRNEITSKLKMLRTLIGDRKVRNEVRDFLDSLVGEYKYGGTPNPWGRCTQTVRNMIPKSVEAQKLIDSGLSNKQLQALLRTEHQVEIQQLTILLREGRLGEVIDGYSVVFVTRDEDEKLKEAEKQGVKGVARYKFSGIAFELTEDEWGEIEEYQRTFNEPARPPLDYGHCCVTDDEMLAYAREGLAQGAPVDWSKYFAPLPPDCES